jgi:hypothetical protein
MNRLGENPMTLKNLGLGLLLAAALIAPSLHFTMFDQPAKFDAALDAFPAN